MDHDWQLDGDVEKCQRCDSVRHPGDDDVVGALRIIHGSLDHGDETIYARRVKSCDEEMVRRVFEM